MLKPKIRSGEIQNTQSCQKTLPMYFNPDFINIMTACDMHSTPYFFEYSDSDGRCYYQFLLREIIHDDLKGCYDITTPFDYGGYYYTDKSVLPAFFKAFHNFCSSKNIISEFLRFCPAYYFDYELISTHIDTIKIADHYYVDLLTDFESSFSKSRKRNIRNGSALRYNIETSDIKTFYNIYIQTMDRVSANRYFYFHEEILHKLVQEGFAEIHSINYNGTDCCAVVTLIDGDTVYYFLGSSLDLPEKNDLNSLLFLELFHKYKLTGKKIFFLGGGNSGVAEFKRRFTNSTMPYYIGKKIHNHEIYNKLVEMTGNGENTFFPKYREKIL